MCSVHPTGWRNWSNDGVKPEKLFSFSRKAGFTVYLNRSLSLQVRATDVKEFNLYFYKCSFSLQMLVHQWKLLLCGLCHTRWKHWERWGCNRAQTLLIFFFESSVFFNFIMKLISFISICLLAGSPRIQGVFWWHSGCGVVTFLGPCKIFESPFYLLFFSLQHLSKSYKSLEHFEILHLVNLLDSFFF